MFNKDEYTLFWKKITKGIDKYDTAELVKWMEEDLQRRLELLKDKDKHYGGSWQKDGMLGAYINLKRKIDRIQHMFLKGTIFDFDDSLEENIYDTLQDLQNYTAMFSWLREKKKNEQKDSNI